MKTVFILGAGASRAAGGPLMYDFVETSSRLLRKGEAGWAHDHFERSHDARRKLQRAFVKSTTDLDNIENLFATFEMAGVIGRLSDLEDTKVKTLPRDLRFLIMRTLEQSILYPINGVDNTVPAPFPYDAFVELLVELREDKEIGPISIINFNYDLCLDYALRLKGVETDYGLINAKKTNVVALPHYKVHGSLNWFRESNSSEIHPRPVLPVNMHRIWERLGLNQPAERPIDTMELLYGPDMWGEGLHPEPVIVPPTWNKGWYQEQLSAVWKRASKALSTAENIFVIGYSLPASDQFFRAFWALSTISDSVIERFWLFDPATANDVRDRFESLLGPAVLDRKKFKHHEEKFTQAIKTIGEYFGLKVDIPQGK